MPSPDAGHRFSELLSLMSRLRGADGCPWDREQTRASLRPFLVEETYEVLDALDEEDSAKIREELGDLLFQVVFHAEIARERGEFGMEDLLAALLDKMVRRHPHVFGDQSLGTAAEALAQWESIKQREGEGGRRSILAGVPRALPGLLRAQRVQHRAARVGFDWTEPVAALAKVREETAEVEAALREGQPEAIRAELGDLLFAVVNVGRLADADPEAALQEAVERFHRRFQRMEGVADESGRELASMTLEEMERLWMDAKAAERRP
ncbi:MAG TPA: nucleoside triphosphate pyrophosphohydrolase [Methylomirabilota bacterium]|nr:nucleoside triphosphate pyrophosphohydrolase [Methylomirabilota bacterium]